MYASQVIFGLVFTLRLSCVLVQNGEIHRVLMSVSSILNIYVPLSLIVPHDSGGYSRIGSGVVNYSLPIERLPYLLVPRGGHLGCGVLFLMGGRGQSYRIWDRGWVLGACNREFNNCLHLSNTRQEFDPDPAAGRSAGILGAKRDRMGTVADIRQLLGSSDNANPPGGVFFCQP